MTQTYSNQKIWPNKIAFSMLAIAILCCGYAISTPVVRAADDDPLPDGFTSSLYVNGITTPTAMEFAPDGRLFVCEKSGSLRVVSSSGAVLPTPFLSLSVNSTSERGLLGVAFDPNFSSNRFVYVYYTAASPVVNRVSRFTASASNPNVVEPGSEMILLDNIASTMGNHNGGGIHFGKDGNLYIGVGEAGVSSNAQDLSNLSGKMLRIKSDGSIPSDNPFISTPGARDEIWAYGLRNPFTFAVDPESGKIFINDVGANTTEEINQGASGANYGWPVCEGSCGISGMTNPIHQYAHAGGASAAITGGAFYRGQQFPSSYNGAYFFGDYLTSFIQYWKEGIGAQAFTASNSNYPANPVDIKVGPDGALYYLLIDANSIYRIQYSVPEPIPIGPNPIYEILTVPWFNGAPHVRRFSIMGNAQFPPQLFTFDRTYRGTTSIAACDIDKDGVSEIIAGPGNNASPRVRIFSRAGKLKKEFLAYGLGMRSGLSVACGDLNGDGQVEIVTSPGAGSSPQVRVFNSQGKAVFTPGFMAYNKNFRGGVNIAVGDINGDGKREIVAGPGKGGGPNIRVFSRFGTQLSKGNFMAYAPTLRAGINVAVGDVDGNGVDDIIVGVKPGGGPQVRVFSGTGKLKGAFFAYSASLRGGVQVATGDLNGDGIGEIITGAGAGDRPIIRAFDKNGKSMIKEFNAYAPAFRGGVQVGVIKKP